MGSNILVETENAVRTSNYSTLYAVQQQQYSYRYLQAACDASTARCMSPPGGHNSSSSFFLVFLSFNASGLLS